MIRTGSSSFAAPPTESDHLVTVVGDLTAPMLDASEHTGYRWLAGSELDLLDDDPSQIRQLAGTAFAALHQGYAARLAPLLDQAFRSAMAAVAGGVSLWVCQGALVGWGCGVGLVEELFDGAGAAEHADFGVGGVGRDRGHDRGQAAASVGEEPAPEVQVLAGAAQGAPGAAPEG